MGGGTPLCQDACHGEITVRKGDGLTSEIGAVCIMPPAYNFGSVVDGNSKTTTFTLSYRGTDEYASGTLKILGSDYFKIISPKSFKLKNGEDESITVEFKPEVIGKYEGILLPSVDQQAISVSPTALMGICYHTRAISTPFIRLIQNYPILYQLFQQFIKI